MLSKNGKTIKCVILDFDRTLVDLNVNWSRVRARIAKLGIPEASDATRSLFEMMEHRPEKAEAIFNIIKEEEMVALETAKPMPGAKEFLVWLVAQEVLFAIISNNHHVCIEKSFEKFGFPAPNSIVGSDDVTQKKPHPEGFERTLASIKVKKEECILIGDSRIDGDLGVNAGITTFIMPFDGKITKPNWVPNATIAQDFDSIKQHIV